MGALDTLNSFEPLQGEEARAVIGPGEDKSYGGTAYLLVTSQRIVYRVKQGLLGSSFKSYPLIDLRELRTLSVMPSWTSSAQSQLRIALHVNGGPPFRFVWPKPGEKLEPCLTIEGRPPRSTFSYPTLVWWSTVVDAERAMGTWRGDAGGYPGTVLNAILLERGEEAIDCLVGWLTPAGQSFQAGGILLTNARCIYFTRGAMSDIRATNAAGQQINDDGAYRFLKSKPLDAVNQAVVAFEGSIPQLALDDATLHPIPGDLQVREARVRAFVDNLRRERAKFGSPVVPVVNRLTCGKCGSPCDRGEVYCSTCGAALST